jgi:hypothetical protein
MRLSLTTILIFCLLPVFYGQNAPVTTAASENNPAPGSIIIPITVVDFENIGAISLALDYDYSVLNFVHGTPNPGIPGWFIITDNNLGNGFHRLLMGWFGSGVSLPDSSSIMDIEFTYISGTTTLAWYDNGGSCEYADENYDPLNDIPTEDYYINGAVCGSIGMPGPISGDSIVCQATSGVFYSTDTIPNAISYVWTVPSGAVIATGQNTNAITVDYSDTASSGLITVAGVNPCDTGATSQLYVTTNILPVANAGNDTTIPYGTSTTLHAASGGSGSYSYYWTPDELLEDPNVQNPETVILTVSDYFTVEVTNDTTSCRNTDDVLVTITGGPLSVNPVAVPDEICHGDSAQLFANAGGGSGDYTYFWSSNPPDPGLAGQETLPNPLVSPDTSSTYSVDVFDNFTTTTGETELMVHNLPTAFISGGDTLCGDLDSTEITIDLTGVPEWSVIYSNGSSTIQLAGIDTSPYQFNVSDSGTYVVLEVEDVNCVGTASGAAVVQKYPIPETPTITQEGNDLFSDIALGNQWYLDDISISGAVAPSYTAVVDGKYYDIVTINTCVSDTSNIINVVIISVPEKNTNAFRIVPNPAKDHIGINSQHDFSGELKIRIFSISGMYIHEYNIRLDGRKTSQTIDISALSKGLYILQISNEEMNAVSKLVVQ